jgi:hypothetical protein
MGGEPPTQTLSIYLSDTEHVSFSKRLGILERFRFVDGRPIPSLKEHHPLARNLFNLISTTSDTEVDIPCFQPNHTRPP